jgi:hypothetical protein
MAGRGARWALLAGLAVAALGAAAAAGTSTASLAGRHLLGAGDHKYKEADSIMLYANKVGPFQNPT